MPQGRDLALQEPREVKGPREMHLHRHSVVWGNKGGLQRETKGTKLCHRQRQKSEVQVSHVPSS